MPDKNFIFANIVSTPTAISWSQTYNAGKLFSVLSLSKNGEEEIEELNVLGKDALEILEKEFFSLEEKSLASIKEVTLKASENLPQENISFLVAAFSEDILYLVIIGAGKVDIKRDVSIGTLLESKLENKENIKFASGFIKDKDTVILQTKQFSEAINSSTLAGSLESEPNEIVESLAPIIHEKEDGGAAAVIIRYKSVKEEEGEEIIKEYEPEEKREFLEKKSEEIKEEEFEEKGEKISLVNIATSKLKAFNLSTLSHPKKLYLSVAIIIAVVFIFSIFLAVQKQNNAKIKTMFSEVYPKAEKKYEEGISLSELNQNLARDSFLAAQKILKDSNGKFPEKSEEKKQIEELLAKVEKKVGATSGINQVSATPVDTGDSVFLSFVNKSKEASAFTQDETTIYYLEKNKIYAYSKKDKKTKEIISNDNFWKKPTGMGMYFSNIYVADKEDGVIKFIKTSGEEYGNSSYFGTDSPDLSLARDLTVDNSIWILLSDGTILKFTRGKSDGYKVSGLDKPLASPSKIYTNTDVDNVYVLDNENSRIVVLEKDGKYKEQYQAGVLKSATGFEVLEKDKKIYTLSDSKIYEIELK